PRRDVARNLGPIPNRANPHAGDEGGAEARAGMTVDARHVAAERIGGDLQPEVAGGAAIGGEDTLYGEAAFAEDVDMVTETEHHAFQRGAPDMAEVVVQAEADQRAARLRIHQRR